jgi:hypothetical protein
MLLNNTPKDKRKQRKKNNDEKVGKIIPVNFVFSILTILITLRIYKKTSYRSSYALIA